MRTPNEWPSMVRTFLGLLILSAIVSCWASSDPPYLIWGVVVAIAAFIVFFQRKVGWWLMVLIVGGAIASAIFTILRAGVGAELSWTSWLNLVLQAAIVALLFTPPMLRWVRPFTGKKPKLT